MSPLLMTPLCVILLWIAPGEARQHSYQNRLLDALMKHPSFWPHKTLPSQEFQPQASHEYRQQFDPNPIFQSDQQSSRYLSNLYLPEMEQQPQYRVKASKHDEPRSSKHRSSVFKLVDKLKAKLPKLEAVAHNKRYPSKSSDKYKSVEIKVSDHRPFTPINILSPISQRANDVRPNQLAGDAVRWAEVLPLPNNGKSTSDINDVDKAVLQLISKDQANVFLNAEVKDLPNKYGRSRKAGKVRLYQKVKPGTRRVCVATVTCYTVKDVPAVVDPATTTTYTYAYPYYYPYYYPTYYYYPYYGYYGRR